MRSSALSTSSPPTSERPSVVSSGQSSVVSSSQLNPMLPTSSRCRRVRPLSRTCTSSKTAPRRGCPMARRLCCSRHRSSTRHPSRCAPFARHSVLPPTRLLRSSPPSALKQTKPRSGSGTSPALGSSPRCAGSIPRRPCPRRGAQTGCHATTQSSRPQCRATSLHSRSHSGSRLTPRRKCRTSRVHRRRLRLGWAMWFQMRLRPMNPALRRPHLLLRFLRMSLRLQLISFRTLRGPLVRNQRQPRPRPQRTTPRSPRRLQFQSRTPLRLLHWV